jgi:hypothetical protein
MVAVAFYRNKSLDDYGALADSCSCSGPGPTDMAGGDVDREFLCGIMDRPSTRRKLASFLQGLEQLRFSLRAGLLKTWVHAGIWNAALREAEFYGNRQGKAGEARPIDALVAPFGRCNLACRGCYAAGQLDAPSASPARLDDIVRQLKQLNVYHVLLVGKGEPFFDSESRRCLFEVAGRHPQIFFSVYSNGTTISRSDIRQLRKLPNLIPILSLDGPETINDWRRGPDVYRKVIDAFRRMKAEGLLFGYISTVFQQNWAAAADLSFVDQMAGFGCRLGYYSLFIAPQGMDDAQECGPAMLDRQQREEYHRRFELLSAAASIPLADIDGIEAHMGCRAKRGATVYIDALTGQVSPCIRAPLESPDCNLFDPAGRGRLAEILLSDPFRQFREAQPAAETCEAFINADPLACGSRHAGRAR